MPVNRNALIRYKTLDKCLQNKYRKWTLEDLIDACSDALYEYEGIDKGVSKRTVQADIQIMRSDKLGYNAPIIVLDKKYYTYEDPNYSITNIPVTDQDLGKLGEAVEFLKQFKGFSHFRELDGVVQKLEDHVYSQQHHVRPVIDFEKNEHLKGLEHLDTLYQAIIRKRCIHITYQSFKARHAQSFDFHAYLLKEFRNRWFVVGKRKKKDVLLTLALDRIIQLEPSETIFMENTDFHPDEYFKHAIGVSASPTLQPEEVLLFVTRKHAPYVLTKPLHHSQKLIEKDDFGITISLNVQLNFELEKDILAFGEGMKVIAPTRLRRNIRNRLEYAAEQYQTELNESGLITLARKIKHKGGAVLNQVFGKKEYRKINGIISSRFDTYPNKPAIQENLLQQLPELEERIWIKNFNSITTTLWPGAKLTQVSLVQIPPQTTLTGKWQQRSGTNAENKRYVLLYLSDTHGRNGALEVLPGSHKKQFSAEEIKTITDNSLPTLHEVSAGGLMVLHPYLLHRMAPAKTVKGNRWLEMEFEL